MICLSKADEKSFRHLSFNQSPAALAAKHTTRQDLNGISNLREHVESCQDAGDGNGDGDGSFGAMASDGRAAREAQAPRTEKSDPGTGRWSQGPSSCLKAAAGGDGQRCIFRTPSSKLFSSILSWATWIASVLVVSLLLSHSGANSLWGLFPSSGSPSSISSPLPGQVKVPASPSSPAFATADLVTRNAASTPFQLSKRSTCESGGVNKDDYNTPLHAGALFIVWFVSTLGCAFPIMATKLPGLRIPRRFFFAVRHFGTGVLIATAFVHLLPTAFISLGDPCLSSFWNKDYPAMPGAIALAAIFLVTVIEMVFHPSRHMPPAPEVSESSGKPQKQVTSVPRTSCGHMMVSIRTKGETLRGRATSIGQGLSQLSENPNDQVEPRTDEDEAGTDSRPKSLSVESTEESIEPHTLSADQKRRKERLQCILLEMGILFHSIFIGMALSVSIGTDFIVLLIAIVFHQTFEGLALGSRIAAIDWADKKWQPWIMALAYGCTTPIGQAIGLATHTLYSPNSEIGLIVVGVMNAVSAGLLTFASLVELLSEDFLSDESWRYLRGKQRVIACFLVFGGAFFMSLVGAWA